MLKNYISLALLFAVCWNFNAEAFMGMPASKAFSYSNTVRGSSSSGGKTNFGRAATAKKLEKKSSIYTLTMSNTKPSVVETRQQTLKKGDTLKVVLPSFSWSVDSGTCNETHAITETKISFTVFGTTNSETSCEIRLYGYDVETSQVLNKVINLTVN